MEPESNKEIDRHIDEAVSIAVVSQQVAGLKELMVAKLENQDLQLLFIKEQTTKTNGTVATNIIKIAEINAWKNKVTGALIISNALIVPIVLFLLYQRLR